MRGRRVGGGAVGGGVGVARASASAAFSASGAIPKGPDLANLTPTTHRLPFPVCPTCYLAARDRGGDRAGGAVRDQRAALGSATEPARALSNVAIIADNVDEL